MSTDTKQLQGIVPDLAEAEYHAHPAFSSTQARSILKSPARYRYDLDHHTTSAAFDFGTAAHTKVLGTGWPVVEYPDEHLTPSGNVSTKKETVAWAEEQRQQGLVPATAAEVRRIDEMAEAILAHKDARLLLEQDGLREASVFGTCRDTGVDMRARFDILARTAVDLKTTTDASPDAWPHAVNKWGYHVQFGHYRQAHGYATGGDVEAFKTIAVEKTAPYLVGVHELDDYYALIGRDLALDARRRLVVCREHDIWPGYPGSNITTPPAWVAVDYEARSGVGEIEA